MEVPDQVQTSGNTRWTEKKICSWLYPGQKRSGTRKNRYRLLPEKKKKHNRRSGGSKKNKDRVQAQKNAAVGILKKFFLRWRSGSSPGSSSTTAQKMQLVSFSGQDESFAAYASTIVIAVLRIRFLSHIHLKILENQKGLVRELCILFLKKSSSLDRQEVAQLNCVSVFSEIVSGFCRVISVGNTVSKNNYSVSNSEALQTKIMCRMVEEAVRVLDHLKILYSNMLLQPKSQNSSTKFMSSGEGRNLIMLCLNLYRQNSELSSKNEVSERYKKDLRVVWESFLEGVVDDPFSEKNNYFFEVLVEKTLRSTKIL